MNSNAESAPHPGQDCPGDHWIVKKRLKKLRRQRRLVERAIVALTDLSRARLARARRAGRY